MTDRFKNIIDQLKNWEKNTFYKIQNGGVIAWINSEALKEALTLATESEQLRKERDELAVRVAELEAIIEARGE